MKGAPSDQLRALAQLDRPGLEVGRRLGACRDLGLDLGAVGREAEQRVVDHADVVVGVGRAEEGAAPDAAILADAFRDRHHQRLLGQARVDGGQPAGLDLLGQRGRFLVLALRVGGTEEPHAGQHEAARHRSHEHLCAKIHPNPPHSRPSHRAPARRVEAGSTSNGSIDFFASRSKRSSRAVKAPGRRCRRRAAPR